MTNTQLGNQLAEQPQDVQDEILKINSEARSRSLQVTLLIPIIEGLIGIINSFKMIKLPDIKPSADIEGVSLG